MSDNADRFTILLKESVCNSSEAHAKIFAHITFTIDYKSLITLFFLLSKKKSTKNIFIKASLEYNIHKRAHFSGRRMERGAENNKIMMK